MNQRSIKTSLFFATLFLTLFSFNNVQAQKQTPKYGVSMTSNTGGYYEYLPEGYNPSGSTLYPLLIFIHGMGEYGDGSKNTLYKMTIHGPNNVVKNDQMPTSFTVNGKTYKFIILSPQWRSQASAGNVDGVINYALSHYKVDPKRIYLTGLSAGGGVVENVISNTTVGKRIAAAVEFCGTSTPSITKATNIVNNNVAIWGIHNLYDDVVSSSKTINLIKYVLEVKSTFKAKKTVPGGGSSHNCWSSRYKPSWTEGGLNIYQWMLQFSRGTTSSTNKPPVANAGSDKTITFPITSVTLAGSGTDADGTISSYKWSQVSGPSTAVFSSTSAAKPTVSALKPGTYTFRLTVKDDKTATDYDDMKVVVNPAVTFTLPGKVQAEGYKAMSGVQIEACQDVNGGSDVGYIDLNDWIDYNVKTSASGTFSVTFRVASGTSTGSQFKVKNSSGTTLATVTVPATGGYQTWKSVTANVKLVSGTQTLRLVSTNSARWNINYMDFASGSNNNTLPSVTKVEAENYNTMSGIETETTTDAGGGKNVNKIDLKDWMEYNITPLTSGAYTFTFRLATAYTGAKFDVLNAAGKVLASIAVPNTGGGQTWKNVTATLNLSAGAQTLMLYSTATPRWNINYFTYSTSSNTAGTQAAAKTVTEEGVTAANGITVAPNPISDRFVLTVNNTYTGTMKVQLVDVSGVVRKEFQVAKNVAGTVQTYLSLGTLPAGNYFVKVQMDKWSQTKQIVKL